MYRRLILWLLFCGVCPDEHDVISGVRTTQPSTHEWYPMAVGDGTVSSTPRSTDMTTYALTKKPQPTEGKKIYHHEPGKKIGIQSKTVILSDHVPSQVTMLQTCTLTLSMFNSKTGIPVMGRLS